MRLARSALFALWIYGLMGLFGVVCLPCAIHSRAGAYRSIRAYLGCVFWGLRVFCGLTAETRGPIPRGEVLIAAKHQSFLDILILLRDLPAARFVMKRSLVWAPILGFYALRIGASPVTRGRGRASVEEMMRGIARRRALGGQLVIFPQGARVKPGLDAPYKPGAHLVYRTYGLPCIPAAANTGHFWPRRGLMRKPGVAVIEFLEPIPEDLSPRDFIGALKDRIDPASDRLSAEARARFDA